MKRYTRRQEVAFADALLWARREYHYVVKHQAATNDYISSHQIPLTKLFKLHNGNCRGAIIDGISCFFRRVARGNNLPNTASLSRWVPRSKAELADLFTASPLKGVTTLRALAEANHERLEALRLYTFTKKEDIPADFTLPLHNYTTAQLAALNSLAN